MSTQVLELIASALLALAAGRWLGRWGHRALYRMTLLTRTPADDRIMLRLAGPVSLIIAVITWEIAIHLFGVAPGVLAFERELGSIVLLVALAWAGMCVIDSVVETIAVRSTWITGHRVSQSLLPLARRVAKVALAVIVGVMVLSSLGYAIGPLVAGLGITGIAIALAAQKTLENVFGAFAIGVDHPFREGDFIRLDNGLAGTVETIGLRSTRVRTLDRTIVTVPNGKLADAQIEAVSERDRVRFYTKLKLALGASAAQVERVLAELRAVLREHPQRSPEQPASVHLVAVTDAWFELEVMAWFDTSWADFEVLRDRLLVRCLEVIAAAGAQLHGAANPPVAAAPRKASNGTHPRSAGGLS
ncbi:MAG: mechanosensitive ion channel family protein [Acidobacteriota bacterium]